MFKVAARYSLALAFLALDDGTAQAHHSLAMFDQAKCETLKGTVRTLQFQYPHSWLWVVAPDSKGKEAVWGFEFAAPPNLVNRDKRWSKDVVKKGDKVTLLYSPIKDGRPAGTLASLTLPNGATLTVGTPACGGRFGRYADTEKAGAAPAR